MIQITMRQRLHCGISVNGPFILKWFETKGEGPPSSGAELSMNVKSVCPSLGYFSVWIATEVSAMSRVLFHKGMIFLASLVRLPRPVKVLDLSQQPTLYRCVPEVFKEENWKESTHSVHLFNGHSDAGGTFQLTLTSLQYLANSVAYVTVTAVPTMRPFRKGHDNVIIEGRSNFGRKPFG